jgi:hypothetical protein
MCQKSVRLYGFYNNKCCTKLLENHATLPWNVCYTSIVQSVPLLFCTDCQICTVRPPQSCCTFHDICAQKPIVRIPKNLYSMTLSSVVPSLIFVLACCLGKHSLNFCNFLSLLKLDFLFSFSLNNECITLERVHPPTLVDLMREYQESSHPMIEIR